MKRFVLMIVLCMSLCFAGCGEIAASHVEEGEEKSVFAEETESSENSNREIFVDFTEEGMNMNGQIVTLPVEVDELIELWGEARITSYENEMGNRYIYTWDALGIYCYIEGEQYVNCIGILKNNVGGIECFPVQAFAGNMTIEGEPWYEVLRKGENMEFMRRCELGTYSLIGEYTDVFEPEMTGTGADYVGIEMSSQTMLDAMWDEIY